MNIEQQNHAVIELWKAVIEQAIKDEDYNAMAALPVDLFILLGIQDPFASQDELDGKVKAQGCSRAFDPAALDGECDWY